MTAHVRNIITERLPGHYACKLDPTPPRSSTFTAMKYTEFMARLDLDSPGEGLEGTLEALWYDRNDDWDRAHRIVQEIPSALGSAVHAYLHREEGDIGNARYWYNRAGRKEFSGSLEKEWDSLAREITGG